MLEVVERAGDGSRRYRMTHGGEVCEFVVARRGRRIWGCSGVTFRAPAASPGVPAGELEPTSLSHEDGWLVWRPSSDRAFRACRRRVVRAAVREVARRRARAQVAPGARAALERELGLRSRSYSDKIEG